VSRLLPAHIVAVSAAVGLSLSNAVRVTPVVALVGAAALAVVLAASNLPPAGAAGGVVLVLALGWGSFRLDALDRSALTGRIGTAGRIVAVVTGEPRAGSFVQRIAARARSFDRVQVAEPVQLELPLGRAPPQGGIVSLLGVLQAPRGPANGSGFDERVWLRRQGIHVVVKVDEWHLIGRRGGLGGLGDRLRRWLRRSSAPGLSGDRRAVLEGVVLGDDAGLTDGLKTSFRRAGLYHLLAVSGQNVVLIAAGALALAWLLGLPRWSGHLGAIASILAYVLAVGPQASVIRAAVSGIAVSAAWLVAREREPWHALVLAAVVLLAWNPYELFDPGFELSFAAVVGIFVALGPVLEVLEGYPVPRTFAAVLAVSATCSVATAPILWLRFGQVPLLGVVANALVEPVVAVLLGLGLVAALVDLVSPAAAGLLAWGNGWVAAYIAGCARAVSALPVAQASGRGAAVAALGAVAAAAYAWLRWRRTSKRRT
jgi:competence protein ComEC